MFNVFVYQLALACDNLQQMADKQNRKIMEIEEVVGALGSLSGMESVIANLQGKKQDLEVQQQSLLSMLQGLRKITNDYKETENRIYSNGEYSRYTAPRVDYVVWAADMWEPEKMQKIPIRSRID
ncbi:MAG: hypothetical protein E7289_06425 [Lachnospiraceae bacterium]|nr:hypothetical protein [Lachnospiraceae bacterium]